MIKKIDLTNGLKRSFQTKCEFQTKLFRYLKKKKNYVLIKVHIRSAGRVIIRTVRAYP